MCLCVHVGIFVYKLWLTSLDIFVRSGKYINPKSMCFKCFVRFLLFGLSKGIVVVRYVYLKDEVATEDIFKRSGKYIALKGVSSNVLRILFFGMGWGVLVCIHWCVYL